MIFYANSLNQTGFLTRFMMFCTERSSTNRKNIIRFHHARKYMSKKDMTLDEELKSCGCDL
jgi:hypothetical protein